ncbi:YbhB/YbcL family Raf kinase inhibitor-like protein [Solimonas marina]|uniref:YbhB/YbcL family Raf kinase inhibitor-like protein n=1 Tax=Solimonas marina TaxID=2714601 RepID=A0A970B5I9_9GAMM|nr:YbhB/YbcL family Raf kinase inhibitor-like protein [Solimonas marina]NKF21620.1 YbhB/YbcL family Raf kinase inhibitor-like protein [Solimonas marina]
MKLTSRSLARTGRIPGRCAFAVKSPAGHIRLGSNRNPQLAWRGAPQATRSFVVTCIDADAPTVPDHVNKEGASVAASLPRAEFVHWLMINLPADVTQLEEGACSNGVVAHGKAAPSGPDGSQQGQNDYTGWFAGDDAMEGQYLGYDGPCPPWNDERVHRYTFEVMALDVPNIELGAGFSVADLRKAVDGHVLAKASIVGVYSLNPAVRLP